MSLGTVASGVYSPATFTPDRDRDYDAAGKARRASGFGGGLRLGKAHYDYEVPSDGVALKLSRNLNDIGVRSFILSGAPDRTKVGVRGAAFGSFATAPSRMSRRPACVSPRPWHKRAQ